MSINLIIYDENKNILVSLEDCYNFIYHLNISKDCERFYTGKELLEALDSIGDTKQFEQSKIEKQIDFNENQDYIVKAIFY